MTVPTVPNPNLPTLDEVLALIRSEIDRVYPEEFPEEMKPQISKEGINLEGSLPYTFFIPPLTPFGIIYLLLRLGELGQNQVLTAPPDECAED
jgi:hypothetical protein